MAETGRRGEITSPANAGCAGRTGQPDAHRPDDEYLPAGAIEVSLSQLEDEDRHHARAPQ